MTLMKEAESCTIEGRYILPRLHQSSGILDICSVRRRVQVKGMRDEGIDIADA